MAEIQVPKDIPLLIQSVKREDRKLAFKHLENLILKETSPHTFKVICRLLQITLPRYDQKSSRLVSNYVKTLVEKQPVSIPYLLKLIADVAETYKNVHPTKPIAHICLCCLNWSCDVASYALNGTTKLSESEMLCLLESQSYLLLAIAGAESKFVNQKAYTLLIHLWLKGETVLAEYEVHLKSLKDSSSTLVLLAYFIKFLVQLKRKEALTRNKDKAVEMFMKTIFGSKTKPPLFILENSQPILKQITHEEFKKLVLPSVQKALLRNPEIVLEAVGFIISTVPLDLSQYVMDLGKSLGTQLHSKEDHCREEAIVACRCLSQQCSNSEAVDELLQHLFNVLNGSEGKLTVTAQRIGVLSGIGNLSYNTVTGSTSIQHLCELAINSFINVLKHEVHEGTIIHTISMLSLWCARLTLSVPKSLITWFEEALKLKTSTSAVRNSYLLCMDCAFHGNTFHQAVDMISVLIKIVEKASAQPSQMQIVTEGLTAFCLLLRLYNFDIETENKLKNVMNIDIEKLPFLLEKFLMAASDQTLLSVMSMIEKLVLDHGKLFANKLSIVNRAILFILTKSYKTRQQASVKVKKMLSGYDGISLASSMLKEFPAFVSEQKFKNTNEDKDTSEQNSQEVTPQILVNVLILICSASNLEEPDVHQMCLNALLPSHLQVIYELDPYLWQKLLKKLNVTAEDFIISSQDELLQLVTNDGGTQAAQNALKTLVQIVPEDISSAIVTHSIVTLANPSLSQVTKEEHGIFLTPEGELFDTSIIENLKESTPVNINIKRESKLYSYKEQLEELELKKELEAKKRAKGLIKEPELTKKQIEAKEKQLERESAIREQLRILNLSFQNEIGLLRTIIEGNAASLGIHIKTLVPVLMSLFSSPLCARDCVHLFIDLAQVVSDDLLISWGKPIAFVTLRILQPACNLHHEWTEIDLDTVIARIVKVLHINTCKRPTNVYEDFDLASNLGVPLSAPGFAYCFSLFQQLLLSRTSDIPLMEQVLEVVIEHLNTRDEDTVTGRKYQDYLPLKQIIDVLFKVICKTTGKIQGLAAETLLNACTSADGSEDCAIATMDEFEVLLSALLFNVAEARLAALKGLQELEMVIPTDDTDDKNTMHITQRIFTACYDPEEENRGVAENIWINLGLVRKQELCDGLLEDIVHPEVFVRQSTAEALAVLLADFPDRIEPILKKLLEIYEEKLYLPPPVLDNLHRVVSESPPDKWEARSGIALAFGKMAPLLDLEKISLLMGFFVPEGLSDRQVTVRKHMLDAAIAVVDSHGEECLGVLLPVFEEFLDKAPKSSNYDAVRQSVVILMGTLARHLDKDDPRVKPIIVKLIESLSTPSQQVQEAVANCLPPLVPAIKDEAPALVSTLLQLLLDSENYGERKGAAYGLAGLVKGLGILSLKQLNIMNTLTTAIQNKKNYKHREGALFAFEMLCNMLGRLFEPYVVNFLPHLLNCFGDGSQYVREATDNTAKAVMSRLSAHGVKLVLPSLIRALEEDSWRTKTGSIELLGAMAFCAPKQLSSCLPSIVPKLIEVLSDSHMKVQNAGAQALKQIGSVIRNPEIQAIVPVLLDALQDPAKKTSTSLAALLDTRFVHFIDAPSLALIMPVVERAFQDRSTETRKMSAQIIGNMYSLTDQKDLAPYLPNITPGLKQSLLDPVPEVRSVSARALGAMVKGMGEKCFEDLMPWLMQTLTSESSSVDRSGAAQGLSEVVGGLGVEKLKTFVPEIIATAERNDIAPHVKDGYIMMFIYLPMVFKKDFTPYIGHIINPILKALADENEFVRDTALRAGQRIVNMYADTAITLLLPELEMGLFDDNWRIRYSSVQLLGDLLYKISGVSGKMTTETADEDDNFGTEQSNKLILNSLGYERRNRVLAGLYMGRSDVALMVRQAALHVWKVVVTNTPRTLREILPTLFSLLLGCLASNSYDKRQVAARTLGDLVRKLGERVLPEIIPILEQGLDSNRPDQRQGVCIGLSEIMASTSREMVLTFVDSLVPTVRRALCDPLPEVRQAAATTFDSLHSTVGVRALDEILPSLLKQLNDPKQAEYTLDGLRQVMAIKSKVVLPYMVPQLTSRPVNTKALSFLSAVAGESLTKHLPKILPALLSALSSAMDTPNEQQELEYCRSVVLAVTGDLGVRTIIDHLLEASKSESTLTRRAAVALLYAYCCQSKVDITQHVPQLLRGLIRLFTDHDPKVLQLSWEALNGVTKNLTAVEQLSHVSDVRQAVRFAASDLKGETLLPGFCLPKGITPILPIFREAILNGGAEDKEQAARGLGEVIKLTSADALKPSVVHITGPLIRVLGDRFPWNTKVSFLETLALLLSKVGPMLKPFLPQLQTTFVRSLSDSHRLVRLRSAEALSYLILVHSRVDTLFSELHNAVKNAEDNSLKETMLHALRCIIGRAGDKMSDQIRRSIVNTVSNMLNHPDDSCRVVAAACLGSLCKFLPEDELQDAVRESLLDDDPSLDWILRHGRSVALMVALKEAPERLLNNDWSPRIIKTLLVYLTADRLAIALTGVRATGYYMLHLLNTSEKIPPLILTTFAKNMNHPTNEVKQTVALTVHFLARNLLLPQYVMKAFVPHLVNGTKEKNSMVKSNSEYALVTLLQLRQDDNAVQACVNILDAGAKEALLDVIAKVLKKVASQPEPKEEDLDDTILT